MNKIDFILGQCLNKENGSELENINPSFFNIDQMKIYNSIMTGDFSVYTILAKHGKKTAVYAMEIANESLKRN